MMMSPLAKQRDELVDLRVDDFGRQHDPDGPRRRQLLDQLFGE